jgi:hypothetical protein
MFILTLSPSIEALPLSRNSTSKTQSVSFLRRDFWSARRKF